MMVKNDIPNDMVYILTEALEKADDKVYNHILSIPIKSKITTLLLSIFLGGLGVDRFYIGDIGLGVAKLLFSWFTFGLWPIIDIYFANKKCKEINFQKIMSLL
ncbi:MAG: TM2 domain-containing protein [Clostridia bacterium]|nr:TM2 domain-containing protein [Clostridia bacterium]